MYIRIIRIIYSLLFPIAFISSKVTFDESVRAWNNFQHFALTHENLEGYVENIDSTNWTAKCTHLNLDTDFSHLYHVDTSKKRSAAFRVLYLGTLRSFMLMMDRWAYHLYLAISQSNDYDVILWGPGMPGFSDNETTTENINRWFVDPHFDIVHSTWMFHGTARNVADKEQLTNWKSGEKPRVGSSGSELSNLPGNPILVTVMHEIDMQAAELYLKPNILFLAYEQFVGTNRTMDTCGHVHENGCEMNPFLDKLMHGSSSTMLAYLPHGVLRSLFEDQNNNNNNNSSSGNFHKDAWIRQQKSEKLQHRLHFSRQQQHHHHHQHHQHHHNNNNYSSSSSSGSSSNSSSSSTQINSNFSSSSNTSRINNFFSINSSFFIKKNDSITYDELVADLILEREREEEREKAKKYNVLLIGATNHQVYKLRAAAQTAVKYTHVMKQLAHPGYHMSWDESLTAMCEKFPDFAIRQYKRYTDSLFQSKVCLIGSAQQLVDACSGIVSWTVRKYYEAMASGCVVIGDVPADINTARFVALRLTGEDSVQIAYSVEYFMDEYNLGKYTEMKRTAREYVLSHYSYDSIVKNFYTPAIKKYLSSYNSTTGKLKGNTDRVFKDTLSKIIVRNDGCHKNVNNFYPPNSTRGLEINARDYLSF